MTWRTAARLGPMTLVALGLLACEPEAASTTPPDSATQPDAAADPVEATADDAPAEPAAPADLAEASTPADPPDSPEPSAPADPIDALDESTAAQFRSGEADPHIPFDKHYVKTNEGRHDVWFPYIDGLGGAYVGVGADQNFTLIAAAKSEFVFLIDIDHRVTENHRVYEVLIENAPTPTDLLAAFDARNEANTVALLESAFAELDEDERQTLIRGYQASRKTLFKHLSHVAKRSRDGVPTTWLSDPAAYDWVRRLFLADRVRIMAGDLTGQTSMKTIGEVTHAMGVPVRVLYLSNAEEYFKYHAGRYRQNVRGLARDADSIVLRTLYGKDFTHADSLWNYQVQTLEDFAGRLQREDLRSRNPMLRDAEAKGEFERDVGQKGVSVVGTASRRQGG